MPIVSLAWSGLADPTPTGGTRNGDPPRALPFSTMVDRLNHCAAAQGRVLFSQAVRLADSPSANGLTDLFVFRYFNRNTNGKVLRYFALAAPKDSALNTNVAVLRDGATDITSHDNFNATPAVPSEIILLTGTLSPAISGAETDRVIRVLDGFRLVALTIVEAPAAVPPYSLSGSDIFVDTTDLSPSLPITTTRHASLRSNTELVWTRIREMWNYSNPGVTTGTPFTATTATFTNLIDGTTARTTSTAGIPASVLNGGRGFGTTVQAHVAVYATATVVSGGSGEVRFTSSQGSVDITGITAVGWYTTGSKISLDTRVAASSTDGRDWDKVDVLGRVSVAPDTLT
ncbi:MAG: hypothetical protein Q8S13_00285, partial [Dehalococcoidia bacterium]|nr:hypothetical protein [Dehalococcoidia bacterium]